MLHIYYLSRRIFDITCTAQKYTELKYFWGLSTKNLRDLDPTVTRVTTHIKSLEYTRDTKSSDSRISVTRFPYPPDQNPTHQNKRCEYHRKNTKEK